MEKGTHSMLALLWKDAAFRVVAYGAGATVVGKVSKYTADRVLDSFREVEDEADLESTDEQMREVYLAKGPKGLSKWLVRNDEADDREEAAELVAEFEEENTRAVRAYERSETRKSARKVRRAA